MTDPRALAPGKVMVTGEYAVLDGAPAVMSTAGRNVIARVDAGARDASPFLDAVAARVAAARGDGPAAQAARAIAVDSSALRAGDVKLGLGSSAAATVAAVACALAHEDDAPDPAEIHRLADAAHGDVQAARGARGSGADVAASTYGGVLAFTMQPGGPGAVRPLAWPAGVHLVAFWTHAPADTVSLVSAVAGARAARPREVGGALDAIARASEALIDAIDAADPARVIDAIDRGGEAAAALGRATGLALEPPVVATIRELARRHGGAAKICGAGGGDVGVIAMRGGEGGYYVREILRAAGALFLGSGTGAPGVRILR